MRPFLLVPVIQAPNSLSDLRYRMGMQLPDLLFPFHCLAPPPSRLIAAASNWVSLFFAFTNDNYSFFPSLLWTRHVAEKGSPIMVSSMRQPFRS